MERNPKQPADRARLQVDRQESLIYASSVPPCCAQGCCPPFLSCSLLDNMDFDHLDILLTPACCFFQTASHFSVRVLLMLGCFLKCKHIFLVLFNAVALCNYPIRKFQQIAIEAFHFQIYIRLRRKSTRGQPTPIISALGRLRQEGCHEFKDSIGLTVSHRISNSPQIIINQ